VLGEPSEQELKSFSGLSGATFIYRNKNIELKVIFVNDKVVATRGDLP
jgi:hypothetical protein